MIKGVDGCKMDEEKWIADLYKNQSKERIKVLLKMIPLYILIIFVISVGIFISTTQSEKIGLYVLEVILIVIYTWNSIIKSRKRFLQEIDFLLLHECNSEKYLRLTKKGMEYGKQNPLKRQQRFLFLCMEQRYVLALIACRRIKDAKDYLASGWENKKTSKIYRVLCINCQFAEAFQKKNYELFPSETQKEYKIFRRNKLFAAQKLFVQERYMEVIAKLERFVAASIYEEAIADYLRGVCYGQLKELDNARKCMEYVVEKGNTLFCKKEAEKYLQENGACLPDRIMEKEDDTKIWIKCDQTYYKKVMKQNKTVQILFSLWGVLCGAALCFERAVPIYSRGTQILFLVFAAGTFFIVPFSCLIRKHKEKKGAGKEFKITFEKDSFSIRDHLGNTDSGWKVQKKGNSYELKLDHSKEKIALFQGDFNYEQKVWLDTHLENAGRQKRMEVLKNTALVLGAINLIFLLIMATADYSFHYKVKRIDESQSLDGRYRISLESVGTPFLFGSADGKLVLKEKNHVINEYQFQIADDGAKIEKESWKVLWEKDGVEVTLSGSDQADEVVFLYFNGKVKTIRLEIEEDLIPQPETEVPVLPEPEKEEIQKLSKEMEGYQAIYKNFFEQEGNSFIEDYDAKGHSRIVLFENLQTVEYLVYDRDSNNGDCGIYVYYKNEKESDGSWSSADAKILDFFAYEYQSKKTVRGEKYGWEDLGTEEYQHITGEP